MDRKVSRSEVLGLGAIVGLGAIGVNLVGKEAPTPAPEVSPAPMVSAALLGIAPANTAERNRAAFVESLSGFKGHVVFEAGDYMFDNSNEQDNDNDRVTVQDFAGRITFLPGARIMFTDSTAGGVYFNGGTGAVMDGWNSTFQTAPASRYNARALVAFSETTDTLVLNYRIDGSAAGGLYFGECVRPQVIGATIMNTQADGLHFANCEEARAINILTKNTGDDGLAFLNYGKRTDYRGGMAVNVRVHDADARGISIIGQREVVISNFFVDTTTGAGIIVAHELSHDTRVPSDVKFSNGIVKNAGAKPGGTSPKDGIFLSRVGENIEINDVRVIAPRNHGLDALYSSNARQIHISNLYIKDAASQGVRCVEQSGMFLDEIIVDGSGGVGFHLTDNDRVNYGRLVAINTCKANSANQAFNFERNQRIHGELLQLEATDTQVANIGARINASGTHQLSGQPQKGIYGRIDHVVEASVPFAFTNASNLAGTTLSG